MRFQPWEVFSRPTRPQPPHLRAISSEEVCTSLLDLCDRMEKLCRKLDRDAAAIVRDSNAIDDMKRDVKRLTEMQEQSR